MTQFERIVDHIAKHGSITSLEAVTQYGIMRLASRVHDLKKAGVPIEGHIEYGENRYGEPIVYSRYTIPQNTEARV